MTKEGRTLAIIQETLHDDVFIKILTLKIAKRHGITCKRSSKGIKEQKNASVEPKEKV
uniref:Uncharacterized protein n=1 Tax=Cajanus cajan TaxID=3821 RepID=A0A151QSZ2_CAJCA|nr:hypothetical protein KK1_045706 [Cajanus cajan]